VAAVLKSAADHDLAVVPCRNATKLDIGNPPRRYDVALSLKEMNRVWYFEPADLTVSVEPGMKFGDFQEFVARHGLWLPLDPPGGARASLGGILATNASGPLRLFYGAPRDMILGMKIATVEGKIIKTGGRVVKNVAGYDLGKLFIGSLGTLGVIVEANFKLYPLPPERATFVFQAGTLEFARDLRVRVMRSPLTPLRIVLLDGAGSKLAREGSLGGPQTKQLELWIEVGGSKRVIDRYGREFEGLGRAVGTLVKRVEVKESESVWSRVSDLRNWLPSVHPNLVILKASLPIAVGEDFINRAQEEADEDNIRYSSFSQTGVGVVYFCLLDGMRASGIAALCGKIRAQAESLGGVLTIDRCPSELKRQMDVWGPHGDDFGVMQKLKAALDPKGILASGRFVGSL